MTTPRPPLPPLPPVAQGQVHAELNKDRTPPYKIAGLIFAVTCALVLTAVWLQFRGYFDTKVRLYVLSTRAGLSMDPGSKVTFNGVPIGRLADVEAVTSEGESPQARLVLNVDPQYLNVLPQNVNVKLLATTVFGNKYIAFTSPPSPTPQRLKDGEQVTVSQCSPPSPPSACVTTEFDTLFETITAISEQVDPIKLNQTLSAAAQALDGLGDKFGDSLVKGDTILADLNQRMPSIRQDTKGLADLSDVYAQASPDLWNGLKNAVITAHTFNDERGTVDEALMASVGFGNTGGDIFERGGPYLVRGVQDLLPTSALLDKYSPEIDCAIRAFPRAVAATTHTVG
ncbi:MAG: MCE family protein, partial [Mycobacterium sp.]|nr:MCE family protein [Mycobacterium sp.]